MSLLRQEFLYAAFLPGTTVTSFVENLTPTPTKLCLEAVQSWLATFPGFWAGRIWFGRARPSHPFINIDFPSDSPGFASSDLSTCWKLLKERTTSMCFCKCLRCNHDIWLFSVSPSRQVAAIQQTAFMCLARKPAVCLDIAVRHLSHVAKLWCYPYIHVDMG